MTHETRLPCWVAIIVNPCTALEGNNYPQLGFALLKIQSRVARSRFTSFPEYEWARDTSIKSSMDATEVVRRDVNHTRIISEIGEILHSRLTHTVVCFKSKYY